MRLHRWILLTTGKWHAWPKAGEQSICGRIWRAQIIKTPAVEIADQPPTDGNLCVSCVRKTGFIRIDPTMDPGCAAWIGFITRHLKKERIRIDDKAVAALAAKLAEIGLPESQEARHAFDKVKVLFLRPVREEHESLVSGKKRSTNTLPTLGKAMAAMKNSGDLARVLGVLQTWEQITGRNPVLERFNPERVVTVMLMVPDPAPYIKHLSDRGLPTLASIFHPNTFDRAKRDTALRGLFAGSNQYWEQTSGQLNIVTD